MENRSEWCPGAGKKCKKKIFVTSLISFSKVGIVIEKCRGILWKIIIGVNVSNERVIR